MKWIEPSGSERLGVSSGSENTYGSTAKNTIAIVLISFLLVSFQSLERYDIVGITIAKSKSEYPNVRGNPQRSTIHNDSSLIFEICGDEGPFFGIVVDAASSGSRIRVFSWQNNSSPIIEVVPGGEREYLFETIPGVASYPLGKGSGKSLSGLVEAAKTLVPSDRWGKTPMYVQATAGMRLLQPKTQRTVLHDISRYLADDSNCPFNVLAVEVISGRQEGYFAYRSINDGVIVDGELTQWRGLLDLGGASTQVTFRPPADFQHQKFTFDVNNEQFTVYATSYLPFGLNVAMERYKEALAVSVPDGGLVLSPCHKPNFQGVHETLDGRRIAIWGSGNGTDCVLRARDLLYLRDDCITEGCPTIGSQIGELRGDFYAISAFFYVAYDLGFVGWSDSVELKPSQLSNAGIKQCSSNLSQTYNTIERDICFQSIYAAAILDEYGLEDYEDGKVTFTRKIDGRNADWTLGSMITAREAAHCKN